MEKKNLTDKERLDWLRLIRSQNVGPHTFSQLIDVCGTAEEALNRVENMSLRGGRKKAIKLCPVDIAEKEIDACSQINARIIASCEPDYPEFLLHIEDLPPVITVLGNVSMLLKDSIAIVGARNASANGCRATQKIAADLGEEYIIVSGMARGIDAAAHRGGLDTGTVAVVAGGIDHIYPKENESLYHEIVERGAIVAECAFGVVPKAENFPRRNRIISGLALGTLVMEAAKRSGSLITARMAMEQNREVMAMPGFPMDPRAEGPNKLIKQGATLVENATDVIEAVKNMSSNKVVNMLYEEPGSFERPPVAKEYELDDNMRTALTEKISTCPVSVDDLIVECETTASQVLPVLLELELAGRLTRHPGNKVSLVA